MRVQICFSWKGFFTNITDISENIWEMLGLNVVSCATFHWMWKVSTDGAVVFLICMVSSHIHQEVAWILKSLLWKKFSTYLQYTPRPLIIQFSINKFIWQTTFMTVTFYVSVHEDTKFCMTFEVCYKYHKGSSGRDVLTPRDISCCSSLVTYIHTPYSWSLHPCQG